MEIGIYLCVTISFLTKGLQSSSTDHMSFVQVTDFDWLQLQQKGLIF